MVTRLISTKVVCSVCQNPRRQAKPYRVGNEVDLTKVDLCREHAIPHAEKDLSLTEVYRADEVFCTGTMGELAPVLRVDGRPIGDGNPGPMSRRLTELFRALTAKEGEVVV